MAYKTPGVYVKEISLFPPSVAEVETAIPAFIGFTEMASFRGEDLTNKPTAVKSLLEFHELFGGEFEIDEVALTVNAQYAVTEVKPKKRFYMYESLRLFFNNGGGKCYIVSTGSFDKDPTSSAAELEKGVDALAKYDEPTMILFPDATLLTDSSSLYSLQQKALSQCARLQDRFAVMDLAEGAYNSQVSAAVDGFRNGIGINHLKYGAAYTPWVYSSIPKEVDFSVFASKVNAGAVDLATIASPALNALVAAVNTAQADEASINAGLAALHAGKPSIQDAHREALAAVKNKATYTAYLKVIDDLVTEIKTWKASKISTQLDTEISNYIGKTLAAIETEMAAAKVDGTNAAERNESTAKLAKLFDGASPSVMDVVEAIQEAAGIRLEGTQKVLYQQHPIISNMVSHIQKELARVPPSGAVAGVYAMVDRTRGVWKAPANVSLSSVLGPVEAIDDYDQESLNVDVDAGKSINAIRSFSGKGTLVWGARTLAGNDNEWRYVPVRRFYNMVEESVKKSTSWAVFEPNSAPLWKKVKSMIDNYLIQKWREGALAGATPDEAFFVKVGLGQTMTPQDVLEGRLIIEIGMAAVRPAEFIILKFSHKMQES